MKPAIKIWKIEFFIVFIFSIVIFFISARYDIFESINNFSKQYEDFQIDEIFSILIFLLFAFSYLIYRRWKKIQKLNKTINVLLNEKELILKEVHHRIKNNMIFIRSLLSLQSHSIHIPGVLEIFQDAISRIETMEILYDKLFLSEKYQEVSSNDYLSKLIDEIYQLFPIRKSIQIKKQIDDFMINSKLLLPIGIILNELLTNAMKHAFSDRDSGLIQISIFKKGNHVTIIFKDNGIGQSTLNTNLQEKGFGYTLIDLLTKQIGAVYKMYIDNGTNFVIELDI